VPNIEKITR